ncbi:hypothetical protein TL16_g08208 [Triparma laevis f. inornata]|uniref:Endonuclease/exonuclease/phosphatase domain-containing protein n=1 Tax=Triparma laevis f. inornata TaxID=1714386 RepID=A0A9W7EJW4_9STRA|nr:hypothetical protein TL16_g08208 [Triparma laevis f. inornata]
MSVAKLYTLNVLESLSSTINTTTRTTSRYARPGKPFLLVGDWNFTPDSKTYEMVTTGALDKPDDTYPKREGVDWEVNIGEGVGSAYMTAFGKEPEYTNWARIKEEPEVRIIRMYI